jgi:hypothetical protein
LWAAFGRRKKKASTSFLKKRSKKLLFSRGFHVAGQGLDGGSGGGKQKSFGSFLQKRTCFLSK